MKVILTLILLETLKSLPKACSRTIPEIVAGQATNVVGEAAVPGVIISTISVHRLIVARFTAGRGDSDVDLRWYPCKEFIKLSQDQKDELTAWQKTNAGKKAQKKTWT
jgi:hypothetical protein